MEKLFLKVSENTYILFDNIKSIEIKSKGVYKPYNSFLDQESELKEQLNKIIHYDLKLIENKIINYNEKFNNIHNSFSIFKKSKLAFLVNEIHQKDILNKYIELEIERCKIEKKLELINRLKKEESIDCPGGIQHFYPYVIKEHKRFPYIIEKSAHDGELNVRVDLTQDFIEINFYQLWFILKTGGACIIYKEETFLSYAQAQAFISKNFSIRDILREY